MPFIDSEFKKKLKGMLTKFTCIFYLVGSGSVAGSRIWMAVLAGQIRIRFKIDQIHPVQNGLGQPTPSLGEAIYCTTWRLCQEIKINIKPDQDLKPESHAGV
jgi:hypothetical protein